MWNFLNVFFIKKEIIATNIYGTNGIFPHKKTFFQYKQNIFLAQIKYLYILRGKYRKDENMSMIYIDEHFRNTVVFEFPLNLSIFREIHNFVKKEKNIFFSIPVYRQARMWRSIRN